MNSLNVVVEPPARPFPTAPHLTSWYAEGRSDALGDRLLMFDNATSASFELLRFRPELVDIPGFETALRGRVGRVETFRHKSFSTVMAVEHLEGGGLTLVSTQVPGKRLSEMIQAPRLVGLHPAFATWLIQQLTPGLADLQRQGVDMAHGALTADRIVLTPDGSFVMVEHVLASAIERLRLSPSRLWNEYGIASDPFDGVARLDGRADVIQLALIVLSVLLGRRVLASQYPDGLGPLLDEFADTEGQQRSPSVVTLRRWLERALGLSGKPFRSAEEARLGFGELPSYKTATVIGDPTAPAPPARPVLAASPAPLSKPEDTNMKNRAVHLVEPRALGAVAPVGAYASETAELTAPLPSPKRLRLARALAVCFGLVALAEGVAIAELLMTRQVVMPSTRVPIVIDSPEAGDLVMLNGRQVGTTPLSLTVGADTRSIRVTRQTPPLATLASGASEQRADPTSPTDQKTTAALALAATRQRSGGLRLTSPIELKVLEGERVLGSTADGPIVTTAGVHELDLVNTSFGYRSHQTVTIRAGQIVSLAITPPNGRVSINALPWAQVWIDGKPFGETPIANISIAVGEHDITFRHPLLGEKRETVVVRSDTSTRVSTSLGR